jgi:hypothetical protein
MPDEAPVTIATLSSVMCFLFQCRRRPVEEISNRTSQKGIHSKLQGQPEIEAMIPIDDRQSSGVVMRRVRQELLSSGNAEDLCESA